MYSPNVYTPPVYRQTPSYMQQNWPASVQPVNGLVSVTGIEGAKAYQLPPNSTMPLFDANEDVFYVKSTDGAGFPTLRSFRFEPCENQNVQEAQYVTKEELASMISELKTEMKGAKHGEQPVRTA